MNYLALGDSISIDDYTEVPGGGAASQFARLLRADTFQNLTVDGQTTEGVLATLQDVTAPLDIVTLTAGGNDLLLSLYPQLNPQHNLSADYWQEVAQYPLNNLETIAQRLAEFRCPVIFNTIYDPTDGDDTLAAEIGISAEARLALNAINAGIKAIAARHGFLLADLEALFHGHGIQSHDPWFVRQIEPNYAGATATALHWLTLYRQHSNRPTS